MSVVNRCRHCSDWLATVRSLVVNVLAVDASFDELCGVVFQVCPHLESLELKNGPLTSVQPLVDSYRAGTCRLRRLVVTNDTNDDDRELDPIFRALRDKNHPITTHLQELEYSQSILFEGHSIRRKTVGLVLQMLKSNDQLRFLYLRFLGHAADMELRSKIRHEFAKFDKVKLPMRCAPMESRRKWAFLSVVSSSAHHPLDCDVVAMIFQFAAKCYTREVRIALTVEDVDL